MPQSSREAAGCDVSDVTYNIHPFYIKSCLSPHNRILGMSRSDVSGPYSIFKSLDFEHFQYRDPIRFLYYTNVINRSRLSLICIFFCHLTRNQSTSLK